MARSPPFEDVLAVQDEFHCPLLCPVFGGQTPSISCTTTQKPVDCLANYGKLMGIRPGVETFAGFCLAATCSARTGDSCWAAWYGRNPNEGLISWRWIRFLGPNISPSWMVGIILSFHMGVSQNRGTPKSSILINRGFQYKPSILGYPYFWKHPYLQKSTPFLIVQLWRRLTFDSTHGVDVEWIAHGFLCSKYQFLLNSTKKFQHVPTFQIFQHLWSERKLKIGQWMSTIMVPTNSHSTPIHHRYDQTWKPKKDTSVVWEAK